MNIEGLVEAVDCGVNCRLILGSNDEIVNIHGDEDYCCTFVGIVDIEVVVISNAVESNGFKCSAKRCCPFIPRLWKSI
jgi:hypothetical protein